MWLIRAGGHYPAGLPRAAAGVCRADRVSYPLGRYRLRDVRVHASSSMSGPTRVRDIETAGKAASGESEAVPISPGQPP